jgi:hypothetical protein
MSSDQADVQVSQAFLQAAANFWCGLSGEMRSKVGPAIDQLGSENTAIGSVSTGPGEILGIQNGLTALKEAYLGACSRMQQYCMAGATEWERICRDLRVAHDRYAQTADAQIGIITAIPHH